VITDDWLDAVITDDWAPAVAPELAGCVGHHHPTATAHRDTVVTNNRGWLPCVGHHHPTATAHRATVVTNDRGWLPRDGEPAATATAATGFGCTACNKSEGEADC
jgi:hypothetical protein